jgi:hypothetical protein
MPYVAGGWNILANIFCAYGKEIFYFSSWNIRPTLYMLRLYFCLKKRICIFSRQSVKCFIFIIHLFYY